jgi:hypothetical protein
MTDNEPGYSRQKAKANVRCPIFLVEPTKLGNDGRRVLGIHFQQGAIVDRFALVVEEKAQ